MGQNGKVTGVAAGSATVTVTTTDGEYTVTCAVTVYSVTIASTDDWTAALAAISSADPGSGESPRVFELNITEDFSAAGKTSGSSITGAFKEVRLAGAKTISLLSSGGSLIRTVANQTFVINGPALKGVTNNSYPLVYIGSGSAVELRDGAVQDNIRTDESGNGGGAFTMKDGTISKNEANGFANGSNNGNGGGVYVSGGTYAYNGGMVQPD